MAEVERLRAVIECKDGEIDFLRGIVMDGRLGAEMPP